jgi:uncharacterized membrane protein YqjE
LVSAQRPSLSTAFQGLLATLLGILQTRLELAGIELGEEVGRLLMMLATAAAMLVFAFLALLVGSLVVVFAFDGNARLIAMGLLALFYALLAAGLGLHLRQSVLNRPPMFAATLAELARDRAALFKRSIETDEESAA